MSKRVDSRRQAASTDPAAERTGERAASILDRFGPPALVVVLTIAVWELVIKVLDVPTYIWAPPSLIAQTIQENSGDLLGHAGVTLQGDPRRLPLRRRRSAWRSGSCCTSRRWPSASLYPLLIASQSIPTVVLAPVFVLVLGFGLWPKVAVVTLFCFFPIVVGTIDGLSSVDREYIRMMLTLDATRMGIFRRVEFPSALPQIFTGTRVARDLRCDRSGLRRMGRLGVRPGMADAPGEGSARHAARLRRHRLHHRDGAGALRHRVAGRAPDHPVGTERGMT